MSVTSISLTPNLREKLDQIKKEKGYSSRSEVVRDAVRAFLSEYETTKFLKGNIIATITVTYKEKGPHIDDLLLHLRHQFNDIVKGNFHIHIKEEDCSEIFITEGKAEQVVDFIHKIRALKGMEQVQTSFVPSS